MIFICILQGFCRNKLRLTSLVKDRRSSGDWYFGWWGCFQTTRYIWLLIGSGCGNLERSTKIQVYTPFHRVRYNKKKWHLTSARMRSFLFIFSVELLHLNSITLEKFTGYLKLWNRLIKKVGGLAYDNYTWCLPRYIPKYLTRWSWPIFFFFSFPLLSVDEYKSKTLTPIIRAFCIISFLNNG